MVEIDPEIARQDGITFVTATVTNPLSTPQRVRVESRVDGPTWSPQREKSTREWEGTVWEGVVEPDRRRGLGFATPATVTDAPLAVVAASRASSDRERTPADALAALDEWSPSADVVPVRP